MVFTLVLWMLPRQPLSDIDDEICYIQLQETQLVPMMNFECYRIVLLHVLR